MRKKLVTITTMGLESPLSRKTKIPLFLYSKSRVKVVKPTIRMGVNRRMKQITIKSQQNKKT